MTTHLLHIIEFIAALVVLAEALNKLERADLFGGKRGLCVTLKGVAWLLAPWWWRRAHVVSVLKVLGWALLSIAAAGALSQPLLPAAAPLLKEVAALAGMALLVIRSRLQEGLA